MLIVRTFNKKILNINKYIHKYLLYFNFYRKIKYFYAIQK